MSNVPNQMTQNEWLEFLAKHPIPFAFCEALYDRMAANAKPVVTGGLEAQVAHWKEQAWAKFEAMYPETKNVPFGFCEGFAAGLKALKEKLAIERSLAIAGTLAAESRDTLAEENAALRKQVSELQSAIAYVSQEPPVDWNPNIDAGEGWRQVAVGEVTKAGDEIWSMGMDHWVPVHIATHPKVLAGDQVRRKI